MVDTRVEVALVRWLDDSRFSQLASLASETERIQNQVCQFLFL